MNGSRRKGTAILLFCVALSALWSYAIRQESHAQGKMRMVDLAALYYGARCVIHHQDPYDPASFLREYQANRKEQPVGKFNSSADQTIVTVCINLPTSLLFVAPFALLPWALAQNLWMFLIAALLALSAALMWDLGADASPVMWVCLAGFLLLNWELPLVIGNSAGVAVTLCILAVWCFIRNRFVWLGVLMLAISLVTKPHDAGFLWLYFLLAGGALRKRALQTLAVAAILAGCAALWIAPASPHWMQEMRGNIAAASAPGTVNDPGLSGASMTSPGPIISLQASFGILWENPRFYNSASYAIAGLLILVWAFKTLRLPVSPEHTRLALAAVAPLTLLPVYHRPDDAPLLLLTIPACAMLWTRRSPGRWAALVLTSSAFFFSSDVPLALLGQCAKKLSSGTTFTGRAALLFLRPAPPVLLATACLYLWLLLSRSSSSDSSIPTNSAAEHTATQAT